MSYPSYLQDGFNFTVRTVPFSSKATTSHFAQELQKYDKIHHNDCLLIHAPNLDGSKIKACLKLKTPVIFIGDFSHGLDPNIPFNQVTGDNTAAGENCVKVLIRQRNTKEFVLYVSSLEHYFCRKFYEGAAKAAGALNVKMHLIEMPKGFSRFDIQRQNNIFSQKKKESGITNLRDIPAINGGMVDDFLKEQINLGMACQDIYCQENSKNYFHKFYNTIFDEIKRIARIPNKTKKIIFKADVEDFIFKRLK